VCLVGLFRLGRLDVGAIVFSRALGSCWRCRARVGVGKRYQRCGEATDTINLREFSGVFQRHPDAGESVIWTQIDSPGGVSVIDLMEVGHLGSFFFFGGMRESGFEEGAGGDGVSIEAFNEMGGYLVGSGHLDPGDGDDGLLERA